MFLMEVSHIFSDKTGTLTSNHMEFRRCCTRLWDCRTADGQREAGEGRESLMSGGGVVGLFFVGREEEEMFVVRQMG